MWRAGVILITKEFSRMNLEKHRATKFVRSENRLKHLRSPLLESHRNISSEYKIPLYEIVKKKNKSRDTIPVHCRQGSHGTELSQKRNQIIKYINGKIMRALEVFSSTRIPSCGSFDLFWYFTNISEKGHTDYCT